MLGEDTEFELEWCSIYTFRCRRMEDFRHGRILFVGDAAHQVSPFGGAWCKTGVQDADNLIWKLKLVMDGKAPEKLLDNYSDEQVFAAAENILNSTRSTDFITPKSDISRIFRDSVLELSSAFPFAQALINSGRLSDPAFLTESSSNTPDDEEFASDMVPGAVMDDAPVDGADGEQWLLSSAGGHFSVLYFVDDAAEIDDKIISELKVLSTAPISVEAIIVANSGTAPGDLRTLLDSQGLVAKRYDAQSGTTYLIRPDQHITARWRAFDADKVAVAVNRATCNIME